MAKLGLCFTGGGAKGAYQIGAAQALKELGLLEKVQVFSGTSIGAANASVLASSSVERCRDIWFNMPKNAISKSESLIKRFSKERLKMIDHGIFQIDTFEETMVQDINYEVLITKDVYVTVSEGGADGKGIFELVKSTYDHYVKKDSKVLYLPLKELSKAECYKAVVASCSIPIIFPAVENDHKKYYDGGVFDNVPIRPLIDAGCDEIIIVHLNKMTIFKTPKYSGITFHEIKHNRGLGGILDFSIEHAKKIYEYGYQDTLAYFKKLNKK